MYTIIIKLCHYIVTQTVALKLMSYQLWVWVNAWRICW